jgi:hypothetical protein
MSLFVTSIFADITCRLDSRLPSNHRIALRNITGQTGFQFTARPVSLNAINFQYQVRLGPADKFIVRDVQGQLQQPDRFEQLSIHDSDMSLTAE